MTAPPPTPIKPAERASEVAVAPLDTIDPKDIGAGAAAFDKWLRTISGDYVTLERLSTVAGSLPVIGKQRRPARAHRIPLRPGRTAAVGKQRTGPGNLRVRSGREYPGTRSRAAGTPHPPRSAAEAAGQPAQGLCRRQLPL
jgi:hypothetical protein